MGFAIQSYQKIKLHASFFFARMLSMTPAQVIKHFGSVSATARELCYTRAAVAQWKRKKRIPRRTQDLIEMITVGALKATK